MNWIPEPLDGNLPREESERSIRTIVKDDCRTDRCTPRRYIHLRHPCAENSHARLQEIHHSISQYTPGLAKTTVLWCSTGLYKKGSMFCNITLILNGKRKDQRATQEGIASVESLGRWVVGSLSCRGKIITT